MKNFNKIIVLLITSGMIAFNACSYAVDMVERAITKRASFSIEAVYDPATNTVNIRWNVSGVSNFAGYEIYITEEPDNEYAGYTIIGGPYTTSGSSLFRQEASLQNWQTGSFTMNSTQVNNLISSKGKGRYFFRVGVISWDENEDKRTADNGYIEPWYLHIEDNYPTNTDISEISGLARVDIY